MLALTKTQTVTVTRITGAFRDKYGREIGAPTTETFDIEGSLQPMRNGRHASVLPEGTKTQDAYFFYTQDFDNILRSDDQELGTAADKITARGASYRCFDIGEWREYGLSVDHIAYIFIRENDNG